MKGRISIYKKHLRQMQYQQFTVEEHLRTCGEGKFHMFLFFEYSARKKITKKIL